MGEGVRWPNGNAADVEAGGAGASPTNSAGSNGGAADGGAGAEKVEYRNAQRIYPNNTDGAVYWPWALLKKAAYLGLTAVEKTAKGIKAAVDKASLESGRKAILTGTVLTLLAGLEHFKKMERPLLVGASRKSFIGRLTEAAVEDRLAGSLACACRAAEAGAAVIRVHDVKETNQALQTWNAIR